MAQSKDDLVREVSGELFSLASGQTVSPDDTAFIVSRVEPTIAELARRNVIYIADAEEIPDEAFNALAAYLGQICGPKFGRTRDLAAKKAAENELRAIQRIGTGNGGNLKVDKALRVPRRLSFSRIDF